ncbi:MAG: hypothetical protein ACJA0V_003590 [Planctomycetota bacterium]|jgi:hypothetical protein
MVGSLNLQHAHPGTPSGLEHAVDGAGAAGQSHEHEATTVILVFGIGAQFEFGKAWTLQQLADDVDASIDGHKAQKQLIRPAGVDDSNCGSAPKNLEATG